MREQRAYSLAAAALAIIGVLLVVLGLWPRDRGFSEEMTSTSYRPGAA